MSRSMLLRGCFLAAKKVAVALDTLIRTQYPHDHLTVIGFAYYAREIRPGALAELTWHGYEYGTNLQHGLLLARRILAREAAANKEIVVITDGEPTAHFEGGQVEFSYPPTRRTISETLREVQRCTKDGITINTFMLERSRALAEFVAHMTRLNRGRAFYADAGAPRRVRPRRFRAVAGPGGRPSRHRHLPGRGHDRGRWAGARPGPSMTGVNRSSHPGGSRRCSPPRRSPARRTTPAQHGPSPPTPSDRLAVAGRSSWPPPWSRDRGASPPRPARHPVVA